MRTADLALWGEKSRQQEFVSQARQKQSSEMIFIDRAKKFWKAQK